tara:strand:- start:1982 stop:2575 length:594 start_codon:yes stop_codon:yes gene_type:complete
MPNWCENWVSLSHDDESKVKALIEDMREGKFLAHFLPEPKYKHKDDWYNWRWDTWGCKWEIDLTYTDWEEQSSEGKVEFNFQSPWSPPVGVYKKAHELGWQVEATYNEGGCDFCGRFENGTDECVNMTETFEDGSMPEWALEQVGDDLIDRYLDGEFIDLEGNLLDEDGKIKKKHGTWGNPKFNKDELSYYQERNNA